MSVAKQLGLKVAPPVKHDRGWRDKATGFHSNDIESEYARLKLWLRSRYSKLLLITDKKHLPLAEDEVTEPLLPDVIEYLHYVNIGRTMEAVMSSIALAGGGQVKPFLL